MSDIIEKLRAKLAATEAAIVVAKASITEEDRAEIALREQIAERNAELQTEEDARRDIDLTRRLDAMRETIGESVKLREVVLKEYPDHSFILRHVGVAYARYEKEIHGAASGKKIEIADVRRAFVGACIVDWNGVTDFSAVPTGGGENYGQLLIAFLKAHQGAVTLLSNEASELAGLAKAERKS